ncbi:MAG: PLP-dependent aminotransferase family protein [Alphaproteobacteria bacterium]|nr:PLP-dependent aminotransferase family protein [Alphaproteobacteria bacterium]
METKSPDPVRAGSWEPRYAGRAERMQASEIRELLKLLEKPDIISFAGGIPDPALFPTAAVREAYGAALGSDDQAGRILQYSISEGDPQLRAWIADHMASKGIACQTDNILITSGSQQALEFLGKLLLSASDTALVTAPTYLGALQAFSASEPAYDQLQLAMGNRTAPSYREAAQSAGGSVKMAYVVPDFANPTGETLSLESRHALLSLARELDIPIIEDAAYTALRYDGAELPPVQALDVADAGSIDASRVIYCGTFSKVFTPGLRVGWICASQPIIHRLTLIKQASDLNSAAINQAVMRHLAETMFDAQVTRARQSYRVKRDAMLAALERHMPSATSWTKPDGGLFVWVTLPASINAGDLLKRSVAEAGVAFVPGHAFFTDGSGTNTMRLSFSLPDITAIENGIERLAGLVRAQHLSA